MQHDITLFFDNEQYNLDNDRDVCPNVIPIKVPDGGNKTFGKDAYKIFQNFIDIYNMVDEPSRRYAICFIKSIKINFRVPNSNLSNILDYLDVKSGITESMVNNVIEILNHPPKINEATYHIKTCIFDIDRTILKSEGFFSSKFINTWDNIMKMMITASKKSRATGPNVNFKNPISTEEDVIDLIEFTDLASEVPRINIEDAAGYYLGGQDRIKYLKRLFGKLKAKGVNIIFLTNNMAYCNVDREPDPRACPAPIDLVVPITNSIYNWFFYEMLHSIGLVEEDKITFGQNMIIYNNNGSPEAETKGPWKYNRIKNIKIQLPLEFGETDYKIIDHPLNATCLDTIDMAEITPIISQMVLSVGKYKLNNQTGGRHLSTNSTRFITRSKKYKKQKHTKKRVL